MTKRRRGRPHKTEHDATGDLTWFEKILREEETAMLRQDRKPKKAVTRAAARLGISKRVAWRRAAEIERENEAFAATIASIAPMLRELESSLKKNDGTDLMAQFSCSAD